MQSKLNRLNLISNMQLLSQQFLEEEIYFKIITLHSSPNSASKLRIWKYSWKY